MHYPGQIIHRLQGGVRCGRNHNVVGVSQDDVGSDKNFCNKFSFTIDLLADTKRELIGACGIGQAEWNGMKFWERTSFVIDPRGTVRKLYTKVNPKGHERVLLDDIEQLKSAWWQACVGDKLSW